MGILSETLSTYKSVEKRANLIISEKNQEKDGQSESEFEFHCVQRHVEEQVTGDWWEKW